MLCPLCQSQAGRLFDKNGYQILSCGACRHRFAAPESPNRKGHVASVYDDRYFFSGGAGYPDYLAEADTLRDQGRRYGRLLQRFRPLGALLDVGSAAGFILQGLCDTGWQGEGIEPNNTMAEHARRELGLPVKTSVLEELEDVGRYDAVTMIQVIAHFVDPSDALRRVARATKIGGLCLIETWNWKSVTARIFGRTWHEYSPPSVVHYFSPERVLHLSGNFNYELVSTGRVPKWIGRRHAQSLIRHALDNSRIGHALANALSVIPSSFALPYPGDDLFWMLLRKNH